MCKKSSHSVEAIDFVLLWVDDSDPNWRKDYNRYAQSTVVGDKREVRFRDWNNLVFWFRSIEKNAPWVNKIHLVTYGHVPEWLNIKNPKLNIVSHKDIFLDESHLPTFNSRAIEVHLHRIPGIAEKFVYFNDDMFLLKHTDSSRFFQKGKPVDLGIMNAISPINDLSHVLLNNVKVLSKYYKKRQVLKKHLWKWFHPAYGLKLIRTLLLLPWPNLTGFFDPHQPTPYLKSTFEEVWKKEPGVLIETSSTRFKKDQNINQYLFRYWQLINGNFSPLIKTDYLMLPIESLQDCEKAEECIRKRKIRFLCINDSEQIFDFNVAKKRIKDAFNTHYSEKCQFEN